MVTFAVLEFGTAFGVQLLAFDQRSDTLPFHVWACTGRGLLKRSTLSTNAARMRAILPRSIVVTPLVDRRMPLPPVAKRE
jgi:hypothetical protein